MRNALVIAIALLAGGAIAPGQTSDRRHPDLVLDDLVSIAEKEIVSAAEAMPENNYAFVPTVGEFNGVRTFAGQVKHLAAANYQLAARILAEKPPHGEHNEDAPEFVRTKEQVVDYLKGSFVYLHKAIASINDGNLNDPIPGTKGTWQRMRLGIAIDAIAHSYDHYGQIVEYLRMNGIVPPASR